MATAKKTTKKSSSKAPVPPMRSFKRHPEAKPFFVFTPTQQTVYWLILCLLVLALGIWVISLSVKVQNLYDQIDVTTSEGMYSRPLSK